MPGVEGAERKDHDEREAGVAFGLHSGQCSKMLFMVMERPKDLSVMGEVSTSRQNAAGKCRVQGELAHLRWRPLLTNHADAKPGIVDGLDTPLAGRR